MTNETVSFELSDEILDQIMVQGLERAGRHLAKMIVNMKPSHPYHYEDLYHHHRYLDALNTLMEYYGGPAIMPNEVAAEEPRGK